MGKDFREFLKEELKDPEFRKEWEVLEPEYQAILESLKADQEPEGPDDAQGTRDLSASLSD